MSQIEYIEGNHSLLDEIAPLWDQLNRYHVRVSTYFSDAYATNTFETRRKQLTDKARSGRLCIVLARDRDKNECVGYCVASIMEDGTGEIDSLFVDNDYRGQDIGSKLTEMALAWLNRNQAWSRFVVVAHGNDRVLDFYRKFNFYPRSYILREPPKKSSE